MKPQPLDYARPNPDGPKPPRQRDYLLAFSLTLLIIFMGLCAIHLLAPYYLHY